MGKAWKSRTSVVSSRVAPSSLSLGKRSGRFESRRPSIALFPQPAHIHYPDRRSGGGPATSPRPGLRSTWSHRQVGGPGPLVAGNGTRRCRRRVICADIPPWPASSFGGSPPDAHQRDMTRLDRVTQFTGFVIHARLELAEGSDEEGKTSLPRRNAMPDYNSLKAPTHLESDSLPPPLRGEENTTMDRSRGMVRPGCV
jgi:hypothetical protein